MKKKSLLDIAKSAKQRKAKIIISDEDIELCVAWAVGEISLSQVGVAKGISEKMNPVIYNYILRGLQQYVIKKETHNQ